MEDKEDEKKVEDDFSYLLSFPRRTLSGSLVTRAIERTKRFDGHDWLV